MIELKTKLRKWGNSLGIVVPNSVITENHEIKENEEVFVMITKNDGPNLKKFYGAYKFKKSTEKMMREIDKALYNE